MKNLTPSTGVLSAPTTHRCEESGKGFKQKQHLFRHQEGYECQICHVKLNRKDNYDRHMKSHETKRKRDCPTENASDAKRCCIEQGIQENQNTETAMDTDPPLMLVHVYGVPKRSHFFLERNSVNPAVMGAENVDGVTDHYQSDFIANERTSATDV